MTGDRSVNEKLKNDAIIKGTISLPMPGKPNGGLADGFEVYQGFEYDDMKIPDGLYRIKCVDVEQSLSSLGGPAYTWIFEVTGGSYDGSVLKLCTAISPANMWRVAEVIQALGIEQQDPVIRFKKADVVGRECGALVRNKSCNGRSVSVITRIMSPKQLSENSCKH